VLLTGETAAGQYPVAAVSTLDRILQEAEMNPAPMPAAAIDDSGRGPAHARALAEAAVALASRSRAEAIVALTGTGHTALLLAALRPSARILALTPNPTTASRLAVVWGVEPIVTTGQGLDHARHLLRSRHPVRAGSVVVFVSIGADLSTDGSLNFVHAEMV
jgi:pyruvate kinase